MCVKETIHSTCVDAILIKEKQRDFDGMLLYFLLFLSCFAIQDSL
jgi:hypothetical protein